jgi:SAM-dependent methyltransferase
MSWREFWNGEHSIYVNARHRRLHYDRVARDIAALIPSSKDCLLDYGCGEALAADTLLRGCAKLYLCDVAPNTQAKLAATFSGNPRVVVLSEESFKALPAATLDMIVCMSVLQYVSIEGCEELLTLWHDRLKPGGRLVIGDVIPPDLGTVADVKALLSFALEGGFLIAALRGLVKTFFSSYRELREKIGLSTYAEADMRMLLAAHGFEGDRAGHNIGHNQARMTFVATRT